MEVFFAAILFCGGLYLIIKGGDFLVEAALAINKITGISQVIIGATFVSVATTLPEVFVSIFAVMADNHGIAVGNAIGAMICNIALVLALYIAFCPQKIERSSILGKSIFLGTTILVVILFAANLKISGLEGLVLLAGFILFLILNVKEARKREPMMDVCEAVQKEDCDRKKTVRNIITWFITGQIMLIVGAFLLVNHGERLAIMLGLSETVVGLTIIAIGTSMPELITVITSIRKRSGGLALGNVLGANIINCTLLVGTCGFIGAIKGSALPISKATLLISLPLLMVLTLLAIVPMLYKVKTYRWQGIALLVLYAIYVIYLAIVQPI